MNCPKRGREIPQSLANEQGVSHCPFYGAQFHRLTGFQSNRGSNKNWKGVGLVSLAPFFILLVSAWFAWTYLEVINVRLSYHRISLDQQNVLPFAILAAFFLVIAFTAAEETIRTLRESHAAAAMSSSYEPNEIIVQPETPAPPPQPSDRGTDRQYQFRVLRYVVTGLLIVLSPLIFTVILEFLDWSHATWDGVVATVVFLLLFFVSLVLAHALRWIARSPSSARSLCLDRHALGTNCSQVSGQRQNNTKNTIQTTTINVHDEPNRNLWQPEPKITRFTHERDLMNVSVST
jgi:hypothetical protein